MMSENTEPYEITEGEYEQNVKECAALVESNEVELTEEEKKTVLFKALTAKLKRQQEADELAAKEAESRVHTPGPWMFEEQHRERGELCYHCIRQVRTDRKYSPALLSTWGEGHIGNARLVSAAPELLEELESMVEVYCDMMNKYDAGGPDPEETQKVVAARAAIAKARGTK